MADPNLGASRAYFEKKADTYDSVEDQIYWQLSDRIIFRLLQSHIIDKLPTGSSLCDLGAGTGRWTQKLAGTSVFDTITAIDGSPDMLTVLRTKVPDLAAAGVQVGIIETDILALRECPQHDAGICMHNVAGFIHDIEGLFGTMRALLKPGGRFAVMAPNKYHGIYFSLRQGRIDEAAEIQRTGLGRFTGDMPAIAFFTPDELAGAAVNVGLAVDALYGVPACLYPEVDETRPFGNSPSLTKLLSDEESFEKIFAIECELAAPGAAARGNNLIVFGHRPADA